MKPIFSLLFLVFLGSIVVAQPHPADDPNQPAKSNSDYRWTWEKQTNIIFTPPPTPIPIDGGLGVILLAGAGLGFQTFRRKRGK